MRTAKENGRALEVPQISHFDIVDNRVHAFFGQQPEKQPFPQSFPVMVTLGNYVRTICSGHYAYFALVTNILSVNLFWYR